MQPFFFVKSGMLFVQFIIISCGRACLLSIFDWGILLWKSTSFHSDISFLSLCCLPVGHRQKEVRQSSMFSSTFAVSELHCWWIIHAAATGCRTDEPSNDMSKFFSFQAEQHKRC